MFERYESYKDSSVEWLGEIPSEWTNERFGDKFIVNKNKNHELKCTNLLSLSYGKIIRKDINSSFGLLPASFDAYQILRQGYIILRLTDLQNDKKSLRVGLVQEKGMITSAYVGIILSKTLNSTFIYYLLYSYDILKVFYWQGGSVRQSMGFSEIKTLPLLYPNLKHQIQIATYLDQKTQTIDKEISLLEQKIHKYKELKETLINETVLRGLDKSVRLKESGVEWIGKIPKGWEVKRLKDIAKVFTGNSIANKELFEDSTNAYSYVATKDIDINTQNIVYENGIYVPFSDKNFKIAKQKSTLLCIEGGSAGKKIAYLNEDVCFVNKLCAITNKNNEINEKYLFYSLRASLFKNQFFSVMNGLIGGVSISVLKNFNSLIPLLDEQKKIANFLDEKIQKIDSITETIQTKIDLLEEFRKTLINDAVTGKIKVA